MLQWLLDIYATVQEAFNSYGGKMQELVNLLDGVNFESSTATKVLGQLHYAVGNPVYVALTSAISIGAYYMLYKLLKRLINMVSQFIPGLKGKIYIG